MEHREGSEHFEGIESIELALAAARVDIIAEANASVRVHWTISCEEPADKPCDPNDLELTFETAGKQLKLSDIFSGAPSSRRPQLKIRMSIPSGATVGGEVTNGAVKLDSVSNVRLHMDNGQLGMSGMFEQDNKLTMTNGSVVVHARILEGTHLVDVVNGVIHLALARSSSVHYSLSTSIGAVHAPCQPDQSAVTGTIGDGAAELKCSARIGSIDLEIY